VGYFANLKFEPIGARPPTRQEEAAVVAFDLISRLDPPDAYRVRRRSCPALSTNQNECLSAIDRRDCGHRRASAKTD
jgi:hypothetical protein